MEKRITIERLLEKINKKNAIDYLNLMFDNVKDVNKNGKTLLHIFVSEKHDDEKCLIIIEALLKLGVNANHLDNTNSNFIQTAIKAGYNQKFIVNCIEMALKYNLDVNSKDNDDNTIVHTAIKEEKYIDSIDELLRILILNGYNPTLENKAGHTLDDILYHSNKYTIQQKRDMNYDIADYTTFYSRQCKSRPKR